MARDLNDLHRDGVDVAALFGDDAPPMVFDDDEPQEPQLVDVTEDIATKASEAEAYLEQLHMDAIALKGSAIGSFMRDSIKMEAVAHALVVNQVPTHGALLEIQGIRGVGGPMKELRKVLDQRARQIRTDRDELRRLEEPTGPTDLGTLTQGLAGMVAPHGYHMDLDGISVDTKDGRVPIAHAPFGIVDDVRDLESGQQYTKICWWGHGRWTTRVVPREQLAQRGALTVLAGLGAPFDSENAPDVIRFLRAFRAANDIPVRMVLGRYGWNDDFEFVGVTDGVGLRVDDGVDSFVQHVGPHGDPAFWLRTMARIKPYPIGCLAVIASAAAPIVHVVGAPNAILDISGDTSKGKSTCLYCGASVVGKPGLRPGYLTTWNTTLVGLERNAAARCDLPFIVDETKQLRPKDRELPARFAYQFSSGAGKSRGKPGGLQRTAALRGITLTSGEQPLVSLTRDEGTRGRTNTVTGAPFGDGPGAGTFVDQLQEDLHRSYGHALPMIVRHLTVPGHRDAAIAAYSDACSQWRVKADGHAVAGRLAKVVALFEVSRDLLRDVVGIDFGDEPLHEAWKGVQNSAKDSDQAAAAMQMVFDESWSMQTSFWGRHEVYHRPAGIQSYDEPRVPHGGWLGAWEDKDDWQYIAWVPSRLERLLEQRGFESVAVLRQWGDRCWLEPSQEKGKHPFKVKTKMGGTRADRHRLFRLRREALEGDNDE